MSNNDKKLHEKIERIEESSFLIQGHLHLLNQRIKNITSAFKELLK